MAVKVPLLDLHAQYRPLRQEILAAIERVCDSQRFIMGPEITALEEEMARMLGVRHAIAVSSGTDSLLLALMEGDAVSKDSGSTDRPDERSHATTRSTPASDAPVPSTETTKTSPARIAR